MLDVSVSGTAITVTAPAALAGERLLLLWDESDKGEDVEGWAHSHVLSETLPATAGEYFADLTDLGITGEHVCRVVSVNQVALLDMLKMPNTTTYVNTGIPDSRCHGIRVGFYGNEGHTINGGQFQLFIGTGIDTKGDYPNCFAMGMNADRFDSWFVVYRDTKPFPRPEGILTNAINDVVLTNRTLSINGEAKLTGLAVGPVGESGLNLHLGKTAYTARYLFGWWSYARLEDEAGNALIDYIPAKRLADDKVGFVDRATGAFVTSTGGGDFTSGTVTNDSCSVTHLSRTVSLAGVVDTATWTGLGVAGKLDDPANWACTNLYGDEVSALPGEFTSVTIPSIDGFSIPAGSAFVCRTLTVGGTMTGDLDWRGLDFSKASGSIDLAGNRLQAVVRADIGAVMSVTDSIGGGAFVLDVPEDYVVSNSAVAFTGGLKFVKTGDGTFIAAKTGQTYSGGTDVAGGTFKCAGSGADGVYGAADTDVTVYTNSTFDCRGAGVNCYNTFVLAGGTLMNPRYVADLRLTADSFVYSSTYSRIANEDYAEASLQMGGHTLTLDIGSSSRVIMVNLTVTGGGTIYQRTGGYIQLGETGEKGVTAATTALYVACSVETRASSTFLDYTSSYTGEYDAGSDCPIKVLGSFAPSDGVKWHSVEMQDGSTLDLSQLTDVWTATCTGDHFDGTSTLSFAPGATVTVDVGEREVELGDQLVSWPSKTMGVNFTWDRDLPLYPRYNGLYVIKKPGFILLLR